MESLSPAEEDKGEPDGVAVAEGGSQAVGQAIVGHFVERHFEDALQPQFPGSRIDHLAPDRRPRKKPDEQVLQDTGLHLYLAGASGMCTVVLIYIFIFRAIIGNSWAIVKLPEGEGNGSV